MQTFRVWAPLAAKVEVQVEQSKVVMRAGANGWWMAEVPEASAGCNYGFILDKAGPFPDPRSPWQPGGVNGLSRTVEPGGFPWTDANWAAPPLSAAVIYELHVGTFTTAGTFDAVVEKLDHLVGLGITHVELMPVNEFSGTHGWGYDGVGLYAPHHAYGGPDGLKRLVDACHAHRLAIILDVVYNHIGPEGNHLGKFGGYFSRRYTGPWGDAINFDGPDSGEVRRFFCDNALMWLRDYHFDGLRLDAVHAIIDTSAEPFLEQLALEVKQLSHQLNRPLVLIPESDLNDPRLLWPQARGGFALDAQWSDDFHHALHALLTGESNGYYADFGSMADLAKALGHAFVYDGRYSAYRRRPHGRPPADLDGGCFLGYMQNHDQVGNRPFGERSSGLMAPGRLRIAAALVLTAPFVPMLFQGEEWGATTPFLYFTDHEDSVLAQSVREGRRREFATQGCDPAKIPDPQASETFARSKLDWSELSQADHADLLEWHRRLIELRQAEPALTDGQMSRAEIRFDEAGRWLVLGRGPIIVVCNIDSVPRTVPLPAGRPRVLLASAPQEKLEDHQVTLPPDSVIILKTDAS